jgi:serine/threonine protein phosphatase PrpC
MMHSEAANLNLSEWLLLVPLLRNLSFCYFSGRESVRLIFMIYVTNFVTSNSSLGKELSVFGVFDGHGGNQVAEWVRDNFVKEMVKLK